MYQPEFDSVNESVGLKITAMAENRTQVNCLEGSYAYHYTTIATKPENQVNRMKRGEEKNRRFTQSSVIYKTELNLCTYLH